MTASRSFCFSFLLASISFAAHAVQINGHVTDAATSQPLGGASVAFNQGFPPAFTANTATDGNGYYAQEVPSGYISIAVSAAGYAPGYASVPVDTAPVVADFSLNLTGSIAGTVRAAASATALGGEHVVLLSANSLGQVADISTNVDGSFVFSSLIPDQYAVCVVDANDIYLDVCFDGHLLPTDRAMTYSDVTPIAIAAGQAATGIDLHLPVSTFISGSLTDIYFQAPVTNSPVLFALYSSNGDLISTSLANTDATGRYTLPNLIAGDYYLKAGSLNQGAINAAYTPRLYGGGECSPDCDFPNATLIHLGDGGIDDANFDLFPGFVITGSVRDAQSGNGIANVTVQACDPFGLPAHVNATATTDPAGNYVIAHFQGATRLATLDAPAHINVIWPNHEPTRPSDGCIGLGGTAIAITSPDRVHSGVDFALQRGAAISGQITNAGSPHFPVSANVALYLYSNSVAFWRSTVRADADGNYLTLGVDPGTYFIAAYLDDFSTCQFYQDAACASVWYSGNPYPSSYEGTASIVLNGSTVMPDVNLQLAVNIFRDGFE